MAHNAKRQKGKFVGGYVPKEIKSALQAKARALDRPLSWVLEKILTEGVKHQNQNQQQPLKEAA